MIFTAYFDETGTHEKQPTVTLAAFLGHAYQWRRFETKLSRIQKREGFRVFHAKDFKARDGEFRGWDDAKRDRLIGALIDLVQYNLTEGVAVHLEHARYANEYRAPPIPRKMSLDSQYGVCFRACIGHLFNVVGQRDYRDALHVVMESGHPNVWDCGRIFEQLKTSQRRIGRDFLASFTVEDKQSCMPLMVADMLAATYAMRRQRVADGRLEERAYVLERTRGRANLAFLELQPDALWGLKDGFAEYRQMGIAIWRAKRAASHLGSISSEASPR